MAIIYFLQREDGDIKIGTTKNHRSRFKQLAAEHGDLKLLGVITGSYDLEDEIHKQFASYRHKRGEFFAPSDDLLKFIEENTETRDDMPSHIPCANPSAVKSKTRVFKFTDKDMKNLHFIGERFVEKGIFGIATPSKEINMTAVIRYLIHRELIQIEKETTEKTAPSPSKGI